MPRTKLNRDREPASRTSEGTELSRRFQGQFAALLDTGYSRPWKYIPHVNLEEKIRNFSLEPTDGIAYLEGYTGIGKSSLVRNLFNFDSNKPLVTDVHIILPVLCNTIVSHDHAIAHVVVEKLASINLVLQEEKAAVPPDDGAIYQEILQSKPELLCKDTSAPNATPYERLHALCNKSPFAYHTILLKMYMKQLNIRTIIVVLDNIESLNAHDEEELIRQFLAFHDCLTNCNGRKYCVKTIVVTRPQSLRPLRTQPAWFSAYRPRRFSLDRPHSLNQIFQTRFDTITAELEQTKPVRNKESWNEAYSHLTSLLDCLQRQFGEVLLELHNYNTSDSLRDFREILSNRRWFQRNQARSQLPVVARDDYDPTTAAAIRALACGEGDFYFDAEHCVANLLHNEHEVGYELIVAYVIRYMLNRENNSDPPGSECDTSVLLKDLLSLLCPIEDTDKKLRRTVAYMLRRHLLFPGPREDAFNGPENGSTLPTAVVLTPRARALWRLLRENSVLLELYSDDLWKEQRVAPPKMGVAQIYWDLVALVNQLWQIESVVIENSVNTACGRTQRELLGPGTIAGHLFEGVARSLQRWSEQSGEKDSLMSAIGVRRKEIESRDLVLDA